MPYIGNVTTSSNVNGSQINNGTITGDKLSLPFDYDSATLYLDNTNNRVGILTASPSSTLTVDTGGVVSIPLASAATPSLIFGTDTNTGIYSPGADQVAISTNGTQRLSIDSAGITRIGSGTTGLYLSPLTGTSAYIVTDVTTSATQLRVGTSTAVPLVLTTSDTERLRITSAGLVGIGTSSPGSLLEIKSAASADCKQTVSVTTATQSAFTAFVNTTVSTVGTENSAGGNLVAGSSAYATILSNNGAYPIQFGTNNTVRATLDSSGRLGIGTSSPSRQLSLGDTNPTATFRSTTTTGQCTLFFGDSDSDARGAVTYENNGDALGFWSAGGEKARIDSSGRLLVGTSSNLDTHLFQVDGSTANVASFTRYTADGATVRIGSSRGTQGSRTALTNGDFGGVLQFDGYTGTAFLPLAYIGGVCDGQSPATGDSPGRLVFFTTADGSASPTERVRISQNGNFAAFDSSGNGILSRSSAGATTSENTFAGFYSATGVSNGTASFVVRNNGNVLNTNNSYGSLSDIKLKENIVDANSQWSDLKALQVRNYNLKEGQTHTQIGLVAQEVELVSPGLVSESPDRDADGNDLGTVTKSVNYSVLYMKAVKALQEAMERIEALEAKVTALETA